MLCSWPGRLARRTAIFNAITPPCQPRLGYCRPRRIARSRPRRMPNDRPDPQPEPSVGGMLLLLLACLPYALLVGMLPGASDFPNEGGGEARIAWAFQQVWAYTACVATLLLLMLALWRASRIGGIAAWAKQPLLLLIPAAGIVMLIAIVQSFEQPGPLLPLVPILLPPVIAAYALYGCLPALRLPHVPIDRIGLG